MISVRAYIAIAAPRPLVERLVIDRAARVRFLPDGWRFIELLTAETTRVGSQMEIEWRLGPAPLRQVIELLEVESGDVTQVIEGPPGGGNYLTTWRIGADATATLISVTLDFDYGDFVGNFLVRRRLQKALSQMLQRLEIAALRG